MYKNGHRGAALVLMAPLTAVFGVLGLGMSMVAVAVCRLPDIDHDYAWLAHRGPTHTIWFAIGIAALVVAGGYAWLSVLPVDLPALLLALLLGATVFLGLLSHLFADGLTAGRGTHAIRPFRPLSSHPFRLGLVRADSELANRLLLVGGMLFQGLAFAVFVSGVTGVAV
jgi:inner membrane protein